MVQALRPSPRGERRRRAILEAAEQLFAERGFAEARLEDVAEAVGIRRASIVYYFRDKRELYDAVLADVLAGLLERIEPVLLAPGSQPLARRIPAAVEAWVDYVGERPSLARLLLREAADSARDHQPALLAHLAPYYRLAEQVLEQRAGDPLLAPGRLDPVHLASAVAGPTIFFVAAMPVLIPGQGFDPLAPEQLAAHRSEVLRMTHRLLGIPGSAAGSRAGDQGG